MPRYRLTRAADGDIAAIFLTGVEIFGQAQAGAYHTGMAETFAFLANYPRAARLRAEIVPPVRAWPYKAHLIVYHVEAETVLILRVRHSREDWIGDREA